MAKTFNIELAMSEPPAEAQARAVDAFTEPASAIGLRLTERGSGNSNTDLAFSGPSS